VAVPAGQEGGIPNGHLDAWAFWAYYPRKGVKKKNVSSKYDLGSEIKRAAENEAAPENL
jgi:hypothetical protein